MSQGIRNRRAGDIFVDEGNSQEYILADVKFFHGDSYEEILSKINLNYGDDFKVANLAFTAAKKNKVKSAIYVRLENRQDKINYPLVRFFEKQTSSINFISWTGRDLLKDYQMAYAIRPRLASALSTQFAYRASKINFSALYAESQQDAGDVFLTADQMLETLRRIAEQDQSPLGKVILALLDMVSTNNYGVIPNAAQFEREIGIYASEFIVPLAIVLNATNPVVEGAAGGKIKINTKTNHMGFDATIATDTSQYLVSVKQGGTGYKHGAYGSVAYLKEIMLETIKKFPNFIFYNELERYGKILDLLLGTDPKDLKPDPNELEARKSYISTFSRKTYRNLFLLAKELKLPSDEMASVLKFVGDSSNSLEEKIKLLNKFAIKIYNTLNNDKDFFKKITKALLQINNFIQGRLITKQSKDDLIIVGVRLDIIDDKKNVEISAQKSYYGSKFASGHGGFLLKEILGFAEEKINSQNQE
jgi:hypothetical protein